MTPPVDPQELLAHGDFVRAVARSVVFDETRVDDVVQQTWVAALERPPRDRSGLRAWLGRVARNFALRASRDEGRLALPQLARASRAVAPRGQGRAHAHRRRRRLSLRGSRAGHVRRGRGD
ncbi:MAG: RNA polymerase sigma factor, partial [Planctomycetota bacterium]